MDKPNNHSEHGDLPQGQQANLLSLWSILEQHRLQFKYLQLQNEQLQVSLKQEISMQNTTLFKLVESMIRDALMYKHLEIASLLIEFRRKQVDMETTLEFVRETFAINQSLIYGFPLVQQQTNSHVSSNGLDAPGFGDEESNTARTAEEATQRGIICKVCNSGDACMVLLPCKHLYTCKPCGVRLMVCPICGCMKGDAIETASFEK